MIEIITKENTLFKKVIHFIGNSFGSPTNDNIKSYIFYDSLITL